MENKPHISHSLFLDQIDLVSSRNKQKSAWNPIFIWFTQRFLFFFLLTQKEYEL